MQRFRLFVTSAERTQYAQELVDHMARVEATYKCTKVLIDRVRCNAQPNKSHRSDDYLVPADDESNERLRYAAALREAAGSGFANNPHLIAYMKNLADVHEALEKSHDKFLRQVQSFCIKELKKFTDDVYVQIKQAYDQLQYRRDAYDLARHNLKSCKPEEIEQRGQTASTAQKEFEKQALVLHELLLKMPENQTALAKAFYLYLRSETDYAKTISQLFAKIPSPERKPGSGSATEKTILASTIGK